ncbi:hypothetical protein Taro_002197 [Colocasia esculenta]|uniref:Uncharacterized protein n=1 Tax=Colocasia esculenta TaxID=4460 RepID=A0A843TDB5_COLES|nr:hypothetical protein [Colocasia esculenta]
MLIHVVKSCFNDPTELTGFVPYLRTRLNLPKSPGSHRTLRELPRQLHHATTFPRAIRQRHTSHDPPTTLLYLLEALGTRGHEARARGRENQVKNLPSGDPITCRIHRLASTPLPLRATATINVHILCRPVHAINGNLSGCQQVNDHPWPPTCNQQQQSCYYTAGGTDLAPLRRGSELDVGREMSSSLSPVGVGVSLASWRQPLCRLEQPPPSTSTSCAAQFMQSMASYLDANKSTTTPGRQPLTNSSRSYFISGPNLHLT